MAQSAKEKNTERFKISKEYLMNHFMDSRVIRALILVRRMWKLMLHRAIIDKVYFCRKQAIALTFDDGHGYAEDIFSCLEKHQAKATFFVAGDNVQNLKEVYSKISKAGHELANHTYSHCHVIELSDAEFLKEIQQNQQLIESMGGCGKVFRFPYGSCNEKQIHFAAKKGLLSIGWGVDPHDWKGISAEEICQRILEDKRLCKGAIVLLHTQGEHTAEALDLLVPKLYAMGYELVTVSQLLEQSSVLFQHLIGLHVS